MIPYRPSLIRFFDIFGKSGSSFSDIIDISHFSWLSHWNGNMPNITLVSESKVPFPRQLHHPISSASFNLKGWNLVCGNLWLNSTLTQNFSPIGLVLIEIWQNMWFLKLKFPSLKKKGKWRGEQMAAVAEMAARAAKATGTSELENEKKRVTTMKNHNFN